MRASACSSGRRRRTACGSGPTATEVEAERVVFTAGAWSQDVARLPEGLVRGVRQSLAWLQPTRPEIFEPERMPVFNLALDGEHFYGFPAHGIPGFKLGRYDHFGSGGDPDTIDREPTFADEAPLRAFAERYFPEGAGPTVALKTCLFEPSPDEHFLIDLHPDAPAQSSAPASRATGTSSARSWARSSPTWRSTDARSTTSACSASTASRRRHKRPSDPRQRRIHAAIVLALRATGIPARGFRSAHDTVRAGGLEPPRTLRPNGT